ncbi:FAD-binding domain-containing protein [Tateyamaria sp. Alg231-49]|uniref:FAD-binding domain-containing protein n=1 Tax=Tateyamaria sp. Alg231-49 TaxID=1922219 RepID=UPI001F3FA1C7|nr:FAD-binding domain-containing protein [Tateyamaria sp. Alg231-49]
MSLDVPNMIDFVPARQAGEEQMSRFVPKMGRAYTNGRNYDRGAGQHRDVSMLSPYIRHRLVLEQDAIRLALQSHGSEGGEKFIQEVIWRGYFKGWLERRPQVWASYRKGLDADLQAFARDRGLRCRVEAAEAGQTGLDYFDAWAEELVETGYLHNHSRMWFASIWIFTLGLPWSLGADFFLRHLLDGDPASNTLGWRWVAGLHTRGKPYHAQDWNITKFTNQRFEPRKGDLADVIKGLEAQEPDGLPSVQPLRTPTAPKPDVPSLLLITAEDCRPEDLKLDRFNIITATTLGCGHLRSPNPVSSAVLDFERGALEDTAMRQSLPHHVMRAGVPSDLAWMAERAGTKQIITSYLPEGYARDWINEAMPALDAACISFTELRRSWDDLIWPYATAGFFKVKKNIPKILLDAELF